MTKNKQRISVTLVAESDLKRELQTFLRDHNARMEWYRASPVWTKHRTAVVVSYDAVKDYVGEGPAISAATFGDAPEDDEAWDLRGGA